MSGEPLDAREIELGGVTFRINKMLAQEAKRVFMNHVRPLLRGALSAETNISLTPELDAKMRGNSTLGEGWKVILAAFTDAPQEHYDALVHALYRHVSYKREADQQFQPLLNDEDNAFQDLDMAHLIVLDVRAFVVNFIESSDVGMSEFQALVPPSASPDPQT